MARELADVLHHFLGDAPAEPEPRGTASLALLSEPEDAFAVSVVWNLAHGLARGGLPVALVTSLTDEELLPTEATPGLTRLLAPAHDLAGLARAVSEAAAKLGEPPGLVLTRLPPAWVAPGAAGTELLGWTLSLVPPDLERRGRALEGLRQVFAACPAARLGVSLHEVRSVREAELAFTSLARACHERSQARLVSYGVLLDDAEFYRSLLARRPLALQRPEGRAARSIGDVARLLKHDAATDAG
jgi:hypothetical protein